MCSVWVGMGVYKGMVGTPIDKPTPCGYQMGRSPPLVFSFDPEVWNTPFGCHHVPCIQALIRTKWVPSPYIAPCVFGFISQPCVRAIFLLSIVLGPCGAVGISIPLYGVHPLPCVYPLPCGDLHIPRYPSHRGSQLAHNLESLGNVHTTNLDHSPHMMSPEARRNAMEDATNATLTISLAINKLDENAPLPDISPDMTPTSRSSTSSLNPKTLLPPLMGAKVDFRPHPSEDEECVHLRRQVMLLTKQLESQEAATSDKVHGWLQMW